MTIEVQHVVQIGGSTQSFAPRKALPSFNETSGGVFLWHRKERPVIDALLLKGGQQGNPTQEAKLTTCLDEQNTPIAVFGQ